MLDFVLWLTVTFRLYHENISRSHRPTGTRNPVYANPAVPYTGFHVRNTIIRPEKFIQYEHMPMANEDSSIAKNHVLATQHVGPVMAVFMVVFDSIKPRHCIALLLLGECFAKSIHWICLCDSLIMMLYANLIYNA